MPNESVPRVLHWGAALGALEPDAARALRTASTAAVLHDSPDDDPSVPDHPSYSAGGPGRP